MEKNYKMVAKTFFGFEDILADELRNLGAMHVTKGVRSVQFEGDKGVFAVLGHGFGLGMFECADTAFLIGVYPSSQVGS